jgi:hypothetical protein
LEIRETGLSNIFEYPAISQISGLHGQILVNSIKNLMLPVPTISQRQQPIIPGRVTNDEDNLTVIIVYHTPDESPLLSDRMLISISVYKCFDHAIPFFATEEELSQPRWFHSCSGFEGSLHNMLLAELKVTGT